MAEVVRKNTCNLSSLSESLSLPQTFGWLMSAKIIRLKERSRERGKIRQDGHLYTTRSWEKVVFGREWMAQVRFSSRPISSPLYYTPGSMCAHMLPWNWLIIDGPRDEMRKSQSLDPTLVRSMSPRMKILRTFQDETRLFFLMSFLVLSLSNG